jgi:hypothetical protein
MRTDGAGALDVSVVVDEELAWLPEVDDAGVSAADVAQGRTDEAGVTGIGASVASVAVFVAVAFAVVTVVVSMSASRVRVLRPLPVGETVVVVSGVEPL